jgi:DNA-binding NarL/FixJ family response regulator
MEKKINFLLADDHSMIRQGMVFIIEDMNLESNVLHASTLQQTLATIQEKPVDILILDAQFPDGSSLSLIKELKKINPELKILIFTGLEEEIYALKYLAAGANGFLSKLSEEEQIQLAIQQILDKGEFITDNTKHLWLKSLRDPSLVDPLSVLTEREFQIAKLYAKGLGNLEIANQLDIKQNSVSTMKKRVFEKLNIDNLVDLVATFKLNE